MAGPAYTISYPRKTVARTITRAVGRLLLPVAFRIRIAGRENFPKSGPLLVVGNHVAAMEAVLMAVYTPWQVEMLAAADVPHERITQMCIDIFGAIPIHRGRVDRPAMTQALDVLKQGGVVAVFPEGGIWDAGAMRAQTGVAWLSYRADTPVLPIGFGGTMGALGEALRLKRPELTMNVGERIPAARLPGGKARKAYFEEYAAQVMEAVNALIPEEARPRQATITDERFELQVAVRGVDGEPVSYPAELAIQHPTALAKLLHRPGILKIFTINLRLPTQVLQNLDSQHDANAIAEAARSVLEYLEQENPYLLTYRFGPSEGAAMEAGLHELLALSRWAARSGLPLLLTPVRRYYSPDREEEVVQIQQGTFEHWM